MIQTVNMWYLSEIISPLGGDDDDLYKRYGNVEFTDESAVKEMVRDMVVPHLRRFNEAGLIGAKLALRYALCQKGLDLARPWNAMMPPFAITHNAKQFWEWIWEGCFPGEDYRLTDLDKYSRNDNLDEMKRALRIQPSSQDS